MKVLLLGGDHDGKTINIADQRNIIRMPARLDQRSLCAIATGPPNKQDLFEIESYRYSQRLTMTFKPVFVHESFDPESDAAFNMAMESRPYHEFTL